MRRAKRPCASFTNRTRPTDSGIWFTTIRPTGSRCGTITITCGPTMCRASRLRSPRLAKKSTPPARWRSIASARRRNGEGAGRVRSSNIHFSFVTARLRLLWRGTTMIRSSRIALGVLLAFVVAAPRSRAQRPAGEIWHFVASGDSRNCGDVVMPGIAETARRNQAAFYWHLGDLRLTTGFDEDISHEPEHVAKPLTVAEYEKIEWPDYIESQIKPFGSIPFFLGIGNHETVPPLKTREDFVLQFADWLDSPVLREQRLKDDPTDFRMKTYFHWIDRGVAFYYLDSATADQFDATQLKWFERLLAKDLANPEIKTIVTGMHKALPESIS